MRVMQWRVWGETAHYHHSTLAFWRMNWCLYTSLLRKHVQPTTTPLSWTTICFAEEEEEEKVLWRSVEACAIQTLGVIEGAGDFVDLLWQIGTHFEPGARTIYIGTFHGAPQSILTIKSCQKNMIWGQLSTCEPRSVICTFTMVSKSEKSFLEG